jgi:hypothetical protein
MNAMVIEFRGQDVLLAYHPRSGEPALGQSLVLRERSTVGPYDGVVAQVIGYDSAGYPGDREVALSEILEQAVAEREFVLDKEPALGDLKEIKIARCKIRMVIRNDEWDEWDGHIPTRNVTVETVDAADLLERVLPGPVVYNLSVGDYDNERLILDSTLVDKVNALVGVKGSGKSHIAKLLLHGLASHAAACVVFDINREFVDLPGAEVIRVGANFKLSLAEVGFGFLLAVIDDMGPMTQNSQGALEHEGARFVAEEMRKKGYATIGYLLDRAEQGRFHNHEMVNQAIAHRLRMVSRSGLFSDDPAAETLGDVFARVATTGGFVVFDLAEMSPGRLRALTSGLNRRLDQICVDERESGRARYPFVFYEEAHFYAAPQEIINLITRGRHLGLTTFFMTNSPGELPEVVFRQLDNLVVTGLSHTADLRTIGKSAVSDEDTLRSLAMSLPPKHALVVGKITNDFPFVVAIDPLPEGFPVTGITRSFWTEAKKAA